MYLLDPAHVGQPSFFQIFEKVQMTTTIGDMKPHTDDVSNFIQI